MSSRAWPSACVALMVAVAWTVTDVISITQAHGAEIVRDGLVHYWSFDRVNGDIVPDLVGGNGVQLVRGETPKVLGGGPSDPQIVDGRFGRALWFDGDGDYAHSIAPIEITEDAPRTVAAWMKFDEFDDRKQVVVGWGFEGQKDQRCVGELFSITAWGSAVSVWGICNDHITPARFVADTWTHVAATYDGEINLVVYVDGEVVYDNKAIQAFQTGAGSNGTRFTLGQRIGTDIAALADRRWTHGAVDEVAIYDRALEQDEVLENMEVGGLSLSVDPAGRAALAWGEIKSRLNGSHAVTDKPVIPTE